MSTDFVALVFLFISAVLRTETKNMFDIVDSDGDGKLAVNEVLLLLAKANILINKQDVIDFINVYDVDGDGHLSFDEFKIVLREQIKTRASNLVTLFNAYDKDKDKSIDYFEFESLMHAIGLDMKEEHLKDIVEKNYPDTNAIINFEQFCQIFKNFV